MITELIGLPGSGKTNYANVDLSGKTTVVIGGKARRFFFALLFIFKNPIVFFKILYWTLKKHSGGLSLLKHKLTFLLASALAKDFLAKDNMVIDDGIMQFILAISDYPLNKDEVREIINSVDLNNKSIHFVACEESVRLKRIDERRRLPRSIFGKDYSDKFYVSLKHNYPIFITELSALGTVELIFLNNI